MTCKNLKRTKQFETNKNYWSVFVNFLTFVFPKSLFEKDDEKSENEFPVQIYW